MEASPDDTHIRIPDRRLGAGGLTAAGQALRTHRACAIQRAAAGVKPDENQATQTHDRITSIGTREWARLANLPTNTTEATTMAAYA